MRVLMISSPVPSHFTPMVPLAWALRACGHDVLVAGQPDVMPAVRSAGLVGVSVGAPFGYAAWLQKVTGDKRPVETMPRPGVPGRTEGIGGVWAAHAANTMAGYLDVAREIQPDLIVADQVEYGALIVAGVLGVPAVHHRWGVDPLSDPYLISMRTALAGLCAGAGLDQLPGPAVTLDPCPPALQVPSATPGTPIRHVSFHGPAERPAWIRELPESGTVVISLGRNVLALNGLPYLNLLLRTFAAMPDVRVVATVDQEYQSALDPLPPSVTVVEPTPLHLFLGRCDAVVHHGGAGSSLTATLFGLPQLVLPQFPSSFAAGERLQALGAGITIDDAVAQCDPAGLTGALSALLTEPGHRRAAEKLRDEMQAMPSPARVAADLTNLAREERR
jgi:glycosyltransferase